MAVEMSSLQRAPDGRVWSVGAARPPASTSSKLPASRGGPRADAQPTADLPTLTLGLSILPTSCPHCSSGMLNREPPLGQHTRGLLTCEACGRQLAWLRAERQITAPLRASAGPVMARQAPSTAFQPDDRLRRVAPGSFRQLDGCGPACGKAFGHDPTTHEQYGRAANLVEVEGTPRGVVRTGLLTVDFDLNRVEVDGIETSLSATERGLLLALAGKPGVLVPHGDLIRQVWSHAPDKADYHGLRIHMSRLRGKLGPAASRIETVKGVGYRLRIEPPAEESACDNDPSPRSPLRLERLLHRLAVRADRHVRSGLDRAHQRRGQRRPF